MRLKAVSGLFYRQTQPDRMPCTQLQYTAFLFVFFYLCFSICVFLCVCFLCVCGESSVTIGNQSARTGCQCAEHRTKLPCSHLSLLHL